MAEGVRDSAAYVQSILGMDAHAFKASVFAEQKQLASFSRETPAKRRELVLRLLGITPLDDARDGARRDAKAKALAHDQARRMLPDLIERDGAVKTATLELETAEPRIADLALTAATARSARVEAETAFERIEAIRSRHEQLVTEGLGVATERELSRNLSTNCLPKKAFAKLSRILILRTSELSERMKKSVSKLLVKSKLQVVTLF